MKNGITVEICCGSLSDVKEACSVTETDRIELNCALELGGLTPSLSTVKQAVSLGKPVIAMVRPRGAGFVYNEAEKAVMYQDAQLFLESGVSGIVFGSLNRDQTVDAAFTRKMVQLIRSYGKQAVFHKAFDETPDLMQACETLIGLGVERILTSGGMPDVLLGAEVIRNLIKVYGGRIEILPGGGVSEGNIHRVLEETASRQIHMSAKVLTEQSGTYPAVSADRIRNILNQI
jgi:copper homeostasis protein